MTPPSDQQLSDCGCPAGECYHGDLSMDYGHIYGACRLCGNPMFDGGCYCQEES
jgi:hypothetical protein